MSAHDEFTTIIDQIRSKSRRNQIHWDLHETAETTIYSIALTPEVNLRLYYKSPQSQPDELICVLEIDDRIVYLLNAEDGDSKYELLQRLHNEAKRCVYGWDAAIAAVKAKLNSTEILGSGIAPKSPPLE